MLVVAVPSATFFIYDVVPRPAVTAEAWRYGFIEDGPGLQDRDGRQSSRFRRAIVAALIGVAIYTVVMLPAAASWHLLKRFVSPSATRRAISSSRRDSPGLRRGGAARSRGCRARGALGLVDPHTRGHVYGAATLSAMRVDPAPELAPAAAEPEAKPVSGGRMAVTTPVSAPEISVTSEDLSPLLMATCRPRPRRMATAPAESEVVSGWRSALPRPKRR